MKIAILGFSAQGQSAYDYWNRPGNEIVICDADRAVNTPADVPTQLGENYLNNLGGFDVLVRTPALYPADIVAANPETPHILDKVTTVTNEFFRICPTKNIIGVTGTKGKGTTASLIAAILEAAGQRVHLGGNIGIPPLNMLAKDIQEKDWVVLELANFQLIDLQHSPHIGVSLMVVPEHLNWHSDMEEYVVSKQQMFAHQKASDIAIYYADNPNSERIASVSPGKKIAYMMPPGAAVQAGSVSIEGNFICSTDEIRLLGEHNWQNVCAAITTAWQVTKNTRAIRQAVTEFHGLPHRLELVRTMGDKQFYNDSFAATPEAAAAAIAAIPGTKVLIMGGFDRQLDLQNLAQAIIKNESTIRQILLIGQSAPRLAAELKQLGYQNYQLSTAKDMPGIVEAASQLAQPDDVVVLSPGFPSFDMFKNFEERGEQFTAAVQAL